MAAMEGVQEDTNDVTREQRRFAKELATNIVKVMKDRELVESPVKPGRFVKKPRDGKPFSIPTRGVLREHPFYAINSEDIEMALEETTDPETKRDFMPGGLQSLLEYALGKDQFTDESVYKMTLDDYKIELLEDHILGLFHQKNGIGIPFPTNSFGFGPTNSDVERFGSLRPEPSTGNLLDEAHMQVDAFINNMAISTTALRYAYNTVAATNGFTAIAPQKALEAISRNLNAPAHIAKEGDNPARRKEIRRRRLQLAKVLAEVNGVKFTPVK